MNAIESFCGCCGIEINSGDWCGRCAAHVLKDRFAPLWEQTYFAQHGQACPFQLLSGFKEAINDGFPPTPLKGRYIRGEPESK